MGIPRCIITLLQERGRNARLIGQTGMFVIFTDWRLFTKLLVSVLLPPPANKSVEHSDVDYVNTMIESQSPDKRGTRQPPPASTSQLRPLTREQQRENVVNAYEDYMETINFLFMPGWGCLHLRSEWLLSTRPNTRPSQAFADEHGPCNNMCYVCKRNHEKWMLPVVYAGAVEFLGTELFKGQMPYEITYDNSEGLVNILAESADMKLKVFGKKTIAKYNVHSFFFQLIASDILCFEWVDNNRKVVCVRSKEIDGSFKYLNVKYWSGFEFRSARHGGAVVSYDSLLNGN